MSLSLYFHSPVQLRRGVIERLWWALVIQPGSTHHIAVFVQVPALLASVTRVRIPIKPN